jgi:hypothetical protein
MDADSLHKTPVLAAPGELVLQNGRQAGVRRPLGMPTTFIGRTQGCDIRLNVEGVDPMHCLLVVGVDGLRVRDLNSVQGTFVNGTRADNALLQHGDLLKVGPFQFRVELTPPAPAPAVAQEPDDMREALRVQAAAIAAQQAALEEEEARLNQRRGDLQQQEEQLAAHLAEKQHQIERWSKHTETERELLRKEKIEHEKRMDWLEQELLQAKLETTNDHAKLTQERQRIGKVYQRLRQRWQKQWSAEKEKYQKLARKMQAEADALEERERSLRGRESAHVEEVLRFNTERELGIRELKDGRAALGQDQERWRRRRSHEMLALKGIQRRSGEAQSKLHKAWQLLVDQKNAWDRQVQTLQKELHGVNNRIFHQRNRIQEQASEIAGLDAILSKRKAEVAGAEVAVAEPVASSEPVAAAAQPADDALRRRCEDLDRLASDLADQRLHLLEQYTRLAEIQDDWQQRRAQAAADLEALAQQLIVQDQHLQWRAQAATATDAALQQRQQESDAIRQELHVWRAKLKTSEQLLKEEHDRQLVALRQREALLREQLAAIADLRQRWSQRRQSELEQARTRNRTLDEEKSQAQQRRVALFEERQQLEEGQRILAGKALALEQYRQEVFQRVKDPAAERRIERLRRRWLSLNGALIRSAKTERDAARKELQHLEAQRQKLHEAQAQLMDTATAADDRSVQLDEREVVLKTRLLQAEQELENLHAQRRQAEESHLRIQDEVETLAKAVYEDPDEKSIDQAA